MNQIRVDHRLGQLIRSNHRHAFRSGEWAEITGVAIIKGHGCWVVRFPDGKWDEWVINDPDGQYQFAVIQPEGF